MRTGNDCLACFMQQALTTVKLSTEDAELQRQMLVKVGSMLADFSLAASPPENAVNYYRMIAEVSGTPDPFAQIKKQSNDFALGLEPAIREIIEASADPLLTALRFTIGANVLDSGAQNQLDIDQTLEQCQHQQFAIDHYPILQDKLSSSRKILFLTDNCGEIVFDKLLIAQLLKQGLEVTAAVRGSAAINDATLEDAHYCGLDKLCPVVANGADVPGTPLGLCSAEFRDLFQSADCILAKGMGNFECLSEVDAPIFFLFTVKCSTVQAHLKEFYLSRQPAIGSPVILARHS